MTAGHAGMPPLGPDFRDLTERIRIAMQPLVEAGERMQQALQPLADVGERIREALPPLRIGRLPDMHFDQQTIGPVEDFRGPHKRRDAAGDDDE